MKRAGDISLVDVILILKRRFYLFFFTFLFIFLPGFISTLLKPKIYLVTAKIEIGEPREAKDIMSYFSSLGQSRRIDTELEVIQSRSIISQVVKKLNLNIFTSSPEINVLQFESNEGNEIELEVKGDEASVYLNGKHIGNIFSGKPLNQSSLSLAVQWKDGFSGRARVKKISIDSVVSEILANLRVEKSGNMSNILILKYRGRDPELSKQILQTLLDIYVELNINKWSEGAQKTLEFLEAQIETTRKNLEQVESVLDSWRVSSGYVELSSETSSIVNRLADFEMRKTEIEMREQEVDALLNLLKSESNRTIANVSSQSLGDPMAMTLLQRLAELEVQKGTLLTEYTEKHPLVVNIDAQIKETRAKLIDALDALKKGIEKRKETLIRTIMRYEEDLKKLPEAERNLARLQRMAKVNEEMYLFLLQKHEEARIARAATVGNVRVIDPPYCSRVPIEPRIGRDSLMFFAVALLFSFTVIFLIDHFDDTARIPEDFRGRVEVPTIGVIPHSEITSERRIISDDEEKYRGDIFFEALRTLRTNMKYLGGEERRIFLITSPGGGEGKSTICSNIAHFCSKINLKVLLIDLDLRKPLLHKIFRVEVKPGFTEMVLASEEDAFSPIKISDNLYLIPSGGKPPNPAEILNTEKSKRIIKTLSKNFDYIFIDSPPVLAVADPLILSSYVTHVLLVVEARKTRIVEVENSLNMMKNINAPVAGLILNKVRYDDLHPYGYNYSYYYRYEGLEREWRRKNKFETLRKFFYNPFNKLNFKY